MRGPILNNCEFKRILVCVLGVSFLMLLLLLAVNISIWSEYKNELLKTNTAILGGLLEEHPEMEDTLIRFYTESLNGYNYEKGRKVAEKYGYLDPLSLNAFPAIKASLVKNVAGIAMVSVLGIVVLILLFFKYSSVMYNRLNSLSIGAEKIMRGHYDIRLPEEGEGELPMLGFQFNQMSRRLQLTMEELRQEKEFLRNMISDISHQIKTPLSSVRMVNELLLEGAVREPEKRQEFLEKCITQLDRMEWLVQTLLKLSRLETGAIEFNRIPVDLAETVQAVVRSLDANWRIKRQNVRIIADSPSVILSYDTEWMEEALENIIKNAIDYTPENGEIGIRIQETGSTVVLTIKDSGVGIPQEELPFIFQRFYQGRKARSLSNKGSGIGLALSRLIIERHGGLIGVSSVVNTGTTFTITFPKCG